MKRVFYKKSLVFVAIVIGLVIFIRFFVKDVYFSRMTEGEAVKILFHYINFGCDDDYDSIVTSAVVQGQVVYLYQTPEQKNNQHEMLQCKQLTDDERYYIFHIIHSMKRMLFRVDITMNIIRIMLSTEKQVKSFWSVNG